MNTLSKVIIAVLVIICLFFFTFSQIKTAEAEMQTAKVDVLEQEKILLMEAAEKEAENAERVVAHVVELESVVLSIAKKIAKCKSEK